MESLYSYAGSNTKIYRETYQKWGATLEGGEGERWGSRERGREVGEVSDRRYVYEGLAPGDAKQAMSA